MLLQWNGSVVIEHLGLRKECNIFGISALPGGGMLCLLAHWTWGHVLGIFFAWVAPSGLGTTALCPCPGVLHPNYVLAISRDVGKASSCSVTFSQGLLTGWCVCVHVSILLCVCMQNLDFLPFCFVFALLFCDVYSVMLRELFTFLNGEHSLSEVIIYRVNPSCPNVFWGYPRLKF